MDPHHVRTVPERYGDTGEGAFKPLRYDVSTRIGPMKDFIDVPMRRPFPSSFKRLSSLIMVRLSWSLLPKPMPGSIMMFPSSMPRFLAKAMRILHKELPDLLNHILIVGIPLHIPRRAFYVLYHHGNTGFGHHTGHPLIKKREQKCRSPRPHPLQRHVWPRRPYTCQ